MSFAGMGQGQGQVPWQFPQDQQQPTPGWTSPFGQEDRTQFNQLTQSYGPMIQMLARMFGGGGGMPFGMQQQAPFQPQGDQTGAGQGTFGQGNNNIQALIQALMKG
jgi:hypothetical protein